MVNSPPLEHKTARKDAELGIRNPKVAMIFEGRSKVQMLIQYGCKSGLREHKPLRRKATIMTKPSGKDG